MKGFESESNAMDDAKVDKLLRRFFAEETPTEFRNDTLLSDEDALPEVQLAEPARHAARSPRFAVTAIASVLTLLLVVSVAWSVAKRSGRDERGKLSPVVVTDTDASTKLPEATTGNDVVYGPIEQRYRWGAKGVSFIEPDAGDLLELTLPELTIEVFPIEENVPARPADSTGGKAATSQPETATPTVRLPEEG